MKVHGYYQALPLSWMQNWLQITSKMAKISPRVGSIGMKVFIPFPKPTQDIAKCKRLLVACSRGFSFSWKRNNGSFKDKGTWKDPLCKPCCSHFLSVIKKSGRLSILILAKVSTLRPPRLVKDGWTQCACSEQSKGNLCYNLVLKVAYNFTMLKRNLELS